MSLSRLNHRLPWGQTHPEIMECTAEFHDQIADACLPQAEPIFDDATALDTAIDMLDPQPPLVERLIRALLLQRQLLATGLPTICQPPFVKFLPPLHVRLTTHPAGIIARAMTQHGHQDTQQSTANIA